MVSDALHRVLAERPADDYYLFCGRLIEPYKRITVLVPEDPLQ